MTRQTTQELQKIVDDWPKGAEYTALLNVDSPHKGIRCYLDNMDIGIAELWITQRDGTTEKVDLDAVCCDTITGPINLDSIREILELRKRGESLEKQRNAILNTAIRSEEKYAELKQDRAILDLEQQAKGIDDFTTAFLSGHHSSVAYGMAESIREQAQALKEQE